MGYRISQYPELLQLGGDEFVIAALNGKNWKIRSSTLASLAPVPTKEQIGLGNVDNTSDLLKPISQAVQEALSRKADVGHTHFVSEISGLTEQLAALNTGITTNRTLITTVSDFANALSVTVNANGQAIANIQFNVDAILNTINQHAAKFVDIDQKFSLVDGRIGALNSSIDIINTSIGNLQQLTNNNSIAIAANSAEIASIKAFNQATTIDINQIKANVSNLSNGLDTTNANVNALSQRLTTNESLTGNLQVTVNQILDMLANNGNNVQQLRSDLDALILRVDSMDVNLAQILADIALLKQHLITDIPTTTEFGQNPGW